MSIARFVRGAARLDVGSAPYALDNDFVPPSTEMAYNISAGTSANKYGGGVMISEKAQNKDWSFTLRLLGPTGSTGAYMDQAARRLVSFLKAGGDTLYFEYSENDLPETLWGQGLQRYEVVTADAEIGAEYRSRTLRQKGYKVPVKLQIKPYTYGKKQRLASAMGGIWMDNIGSADGSAWGLRVLETTANKMTNPVFGNTTWNNGWTAAANIIETQNVDGRYLFPGSSSSALITAKASTNNTYTQSIAAGNTNAHSFSAIVCRPDGAAVDSNDVVIYYGAAKTTTFRALGNGLYLIFSDNIAGIAAATATGVQVKIGRSIYLLAYQMEEKAYHTAMCFGDMLGCFWSGTAHASVSNRTGARLSLPLANDTFLNNLWSVHIIWQPDYPSTQAGDRYLFCTGATSIRCTYTAADDKFNLLDNTNTASTAATAFSAGDVLEILCSGGNSGLAIYVKNHTTGNTYSGTNATYTIPTPGSGLYFGSDSLWGTQADGIFRLFETYNDDLTSAQNTTLQTTWGPILTGGGARVGDMPFLWTKDGDDIVDAYYDATHNNFAVAGGIPGDKPASTVIDGRLSQNWNVIFGVYLSNMATPNYVSPAELFADYNGTVGAGCVSGEYKQAAGLGTVVPWENTISIHSNLWKALAGRSAYIIGRVQDAGANLTVKADIATDVWTSYGAYIATDPPSANFGLINFLSFPMPEPESYGTDYGIVLSTTGATITVSHLRTTGSGNLNLDYMQVLPQPVMYMYVLAGANSGFIYDGKTVMPYNTTTLSGVGEQQPLGDLIALEPGKYNTLVSLMGRNTTDPIITWTMTYYRVFVTPRWSLL